MPDQAITTKVLTKRFGHHAAVDSLTMTVETGEVYGLLGRNGAGKTTTIGMLTTLLAPSSGEAQVAGHDVVAEAAAVRRTVGVVLQEHALDRWLSIEENLLYLAAAYRIPGQERRDRVGLALERLGLSEVRRQVVGELSGGNHRRVEIAAGILGEPRVLFLDEPTVGLDVEARRNIWEHVQGLTGAGITVVLTTHYLEEADALANRVGIMERGRLVLEGTPQEVKAAVGRREITARVEGTWPDDVLAGLRALGPLSPGNGGEIVLRLVSRDGVQSALGLLAASSLSLTELHVGVASLDEAFLAAIRQRRPCEGSSV